MLAVRCCPPGQQYPVRAFVFCEFLVCGDDPREQYSQPLEAIVAEMVFHTFGLSFLLFKPGYQLRLGSVYNYESALWPASRRKKLTRHYLRRPTRCLRVLSGRFYERVHPAEHVGNLFRWWTAG